MKRPVYKPSFDTIFINAIASAKIEGIYFDKETEEKMRNKMKNIVKIAIKSHDNDFHSTWRGVLKTLLDAYHYNDELPMEKGKLVIIINELSLGIYLSHQNQFKYSNNPTMEEHIEHIRKYLKIDEEDLLLNEEVDQYLKDVDWDNSETFILDTSLDYPNNNPIYSH